MICRTVVWDSYMACPNQHVLLDGVSATTFKTCFIKLPSAGSPHHPQPHLSTFKKPGSLSQLMDTSVLWSASHWLGMFLIQKMSCPAISICCTICKQHICHFMLCIQSHCFAEVTHTLIQTNSHQTMGENVRISCPTRHVELPQQS